MDLDAKLKRSYEIGKNETVAGNVATYIPELAKVHKDDFGICMMQMNGNVMGYGDYEKRFSMQSVSKLIGLAMALKEFGADSVFSDVLMEPTGEPFNSIIKLDTTSSKPFNPFINAGAIQIVSQIVRSFSFENIMDFTRIICMDDEISLNEDVFNSENLTGDRNRCIAYLLKSKNELRADPAKTLDVYFKMCSMNVNAKDLAALGMVLSNQGTNPLTGQTILTGEQTRLINTLMFDCGMYDGSGEFAVRVGIPSKSGVGGGICSSTKIGVGIGCYGPAIDIHGNSAGGIAALEYLSTELKLHVLD